MEISDKVQEVAAPSGTDKESNHAPFKEAMPWAITIMGRWIQSILFRKVISFTTPEDFWDTLKAQMGKN